MRYLIALLLVVITLPAMARIGETHTQCVKRYGEAVKVDLEEHSAEFLKEGINIRVWYHDGACDKIEFTKVDHGQFSEDEYKLLREVNLPAGGVWRSGGGFSYDYVSGDYFANRSWLGGTVTIVTRAYRDRVEAGLASERAAKDDANKKKLQGF